MTTSAHYHRDHLIAGTLIWLFGVNTAAYLVECGCDHQHGHTLVPGPVQIAAMDR